MSSVVVLRQNAARDELRRVNSELRATQSLLAENTRIAERVRIARELHDLVGHHLTALTLNLEVVTHLVDGKVLEHVQQAHSLARLLLADVREVVSDMRQDDMVNLADALHTLTEGVPKPRIHLDLPSQDVMTEPPVADAGNNDAPIDGVLANYLSNNIYANRTGVDLDVVFTVQLARNVTVQLGLST